MIVRVMLTEVNVCCRRLVAMCLRVQDPVPLSRTMRGESHVQQPSASTRSL